MILKIWRFILLLGIFGFPGQVVLSQTYLSKDNYIGTWETPASWDPPWSAPQTDVNGHDININGYITVNDSILFSGSGKLTVKDTLVIKGGLTINDDCKLKIEDNGILIVWGNLTIGDNAQIEVNGYIIINGNIIKTGDINYGQFKSNDNPVRVFVGGTIPSELTNDNPAYKALNCTAPPTAPYPNSTCSYGNLTDIISDPIYSFFQSTCITTTPLISAGGPITFCEGGSVILTSSAGSTYLWSTGATTPNISVTKTGNYSVQVTDANGCQSASSAATIVTVNALPVTPTITAGGSTVFCDGGSVNLTSSPGTSYLWSNAATTRSINVTTAGTYAVRITNAGGCQSAASVSTIVTVNALPAAPTIGVDGPTTFCEGGSVTLTSSEGISYLWSNAATTPGINVNNAGRYTVKVTDANGCQSAVSAPTTVNVNSLPQVYAGADTTIPNGTNMTIDATVTGTGPFNYNWSPSGLLEDAFAEDPTTLNLIQSTIFTLTATSISTSCSDSNEVIINISGGVLSSNPVANPGTVCAGSEVHLHALASGGSGTYTYAWTSTPAGFVSSVSNPVVNPAVSTTYHVIVNDGFNTVNSQVPVNVNTLPATPKITADGLTTFCTGGNVILTSDTATCYLWSDAETSQSINITTTGSYTVQVTDANGCRSATSIPTLVLVNALPLTPTITANGPTTFCEGGRVILTADAGTDYLWSNAATSQSINVTEAGSYTVQVTSAEGCQSAASVPTIVTVNDLPVLPTITVEGPATFCAGGSVTLTSSEGTTYLWSDGSTSQHINVNETGSYTVQVTNSNGCLSSPSVSTSVDVRSLPPVDITSSNNPMCLNEQRTLTGTPDLGSFSISDGPGTISGNVLSATEAGIIVLEYDYTDVCSNKATQLITVSEIPVAIAGPEQELKFIYETQMEAELSSSETGEWSLISGSGQLSDIHSPTARVTGLSAGENTFLWNVSNGNCESAAEVKITVYDLLVPSVITPNGDGKNDYFRISETDGQVELIIFNRWGITEYENSNYSDDWNGQNNKGRELPDDTYFYIVKIENGTIIKGSVLIKR